MTNKGIFIRLFNIAWKVLFISLFLVLVSSCSSDDDDDLVGDWVELSDFAGDARSGAVVFVIDDIAYVGLGYNSDNSDSRDSVKDFYGYDASENNWFKIASFPDSAAGRNGAVAFATDTKGYVGLGYDGINKLKDFWEYDPESNEWSRIADFGGSARYEAVAFAIENIGYVGTGYDGSAQKDFYKYEPSSDTWTVINSLPDGKRQGATAFVIDNKGYVVTGVDNGDYEDRFCCYDPSTGLWTELRDIANNSDDDYDDDYSGIVGNKKVSFAVDGKGYVATGGKGTYGTSVWEYNPDTDLWDQKTSLEATGRNRAVAFGIGDMGYITTGQNSSYYMDDLWGFKPDNEQVDNNKALLVNP